MDPKRRKMDELFTGNSFHNDSMADTFNGFRKDGTLCDVVLKVDGKKFPAHRLVLSAASDYYKAMFEVEMKEKVTGEVEVKDTSVETLELCLEFVYTGRVNITEYNMHSVWRASSLHQIEDLEDACVQYVLDHINIKTCLKSFAMAKTYGSGVLEREVLYFIRKNLHEVSKIDEFNQVIDKPTFIRIIDFPWNQGQEMAYHVLMSWVKYDVENRKAVLPEMLEHVRLERFPVEFLTREIESNELLRANPKCRKILQKATTRRVRAFASKIPSAEFVRGVANPGEANAEILIAETGSTSLSSFNVTTHQWNDFPDAPGQLRYSAVLGDKIFVLVEGEQHMHFLKKGSTSWQKTSDVVFGKGKSAVAVLDGNVYIGDCRTLHCYSPDGNTWDKTLAMQVSRYSYTLHGINSCMYVIGGITSLGKGQNVDIWCTGRSTWTCGALMPKARKHHSAAAMDNKLYVLGEELGKDAANCLDIYHASLDMWSTATNFVSVPRSIVGMCARNNVLYLIHEDGGQYGIKYVDLKKKAILALPIRIARWKGAAIAAV